MNVQTRKVDIVESADEYFVELTPQEVKRAIKAYVENRSHHVVSITLDTNGAYVGDECGMNTHYETYFDKATVVITPNR